MKRTQTERGTKMNGENRCGECMGRYEMKNETPPCGQKGCPVHEDELAGKTTGHYRFARKEQAEALPPRVDKAS
jgi:hypothetical protein